MSKIFIYLVHATQPGPLDSKLGVWIFEQCFKATNHVHLMLMLLAFKSDSNILFLNGSMILNKHCCPSTKKQIDVGILLYRISLFFLYAFH